MSHSARAVIEGFGEVDVIHNGDWDGLATIHWTDPRSGELKKVDLPAPLLLELSKKLAVSIVRDRMISALERI